MANYLRKNSTLTRCPSFRRTDPELSSVLTNLGKYFTISFKKLAKFISENGSVSVKIFISGRDDPAFKLCHSGSIHLFNLPTPPDNVRIDESRRGKFLLAWNPVDGEHVTDYLVQFRCADETNWSGIRSGLTGSIQLSGLANQKQYYFRLATETVAGRSEFSRPVGPEMVRSICGPPEDVSCLLVTDKVIKIRWADPQDLDKDLVINFYDIRYWKEDQPESSALKMSSQQKTVKLDQLDPGTTYNIRVAAVCRAEGSSPFSPSLKISTEIEAERVAYIVREVSSLTGGSADPATGMAIYNVPLQSAETNGVNRRVFGFQNLQKFQRKTILLVGASGAGKTTLINAMMNHILDVQFQDDFRFKLIEEPKLSQAGSQTKNVTAYDLFHVKGSLLDYWLTIVDTPGFGDTEGLERDNAIREQIRQYFSDPGGIQQVDAVCLVVQAPSARLTPTQRYIFDSILSIFGNDIKDNIRIMATFADNQEPPVLTAIEEDKMECPLDAKGRPFCHKFNSSGYFPSEDNDPFNNLYFEMGMKSFANFFQDLHGMKTTSLTLSRQVLEERKRLEVAVEGLHQRIQTGLVKVEEFKQMEKILSDHQSDWAANQEFQFELESIVPEKKLVADHLPRNCNKCQWTCHFSCLEDPSACFAMDPQGNCKVCPGNCSYEFHSNEEHEWEQVVKKVFKSSEVVRQGFQSANNQPATYEEIVEQMSTERNNFEKKILDLVENTHQLIQRLDEIALRSHPFSSTPDYIDLIIAVEKQERRPGYSTRIENLQKIRQMAEITAKLINKEEVFDANVFLNSVV